jgi:hypothetical protein
VRGSPAEIKPLISAVQANAPEGAAVSGSLLNPDLDLRRFSCPTCSELLEGLGGLDEDRRFTAHGLVAPKDQVDIQGINLDAAAHAARLLGGNKGRARAEERIDAMSPRLETSSSASSSMAVGLTVG